MLIPGPCWFSGIYPVYNHYPCTFIFLSDLPQKSHKTLFQLFHKPNCLNEQRRTIVWDIKKEPEFKCKVSLGSTQQNHLNHQQFFGLLLPLGVVVACSWYEISRKYELVLASENWKMGKVGRILIKASKGPHVSDSELWSIDGWAANKMVTFKKSNQDLIYQLLSW